MNTCARYTCYDSYIKRHLNEYRYIFHQIWKKFMFNSIIREIIDSIKITTSATTSHQENSIIDNGDSPIVWFHLWYHGTGEQNLPRCEPPSSTGKVGKCLEKPTTEKMFNSAVSSSLYHSNDLLYGINEYFVHQLQCYQNNSARILSMRHEYDHMTPELKQFH